MVSSEGAADDPENKLMPSVVGGLAVNIIEKPPYSTPAPRLASMA